MATLFIQTGQYTEAVASLSAALKTLKAIHSWQSSSPLSRPAACTTTERENNSHSRTNRQEQDDEEESNSHLPAPFLAKGSKSIQEINFFNVLRERVGDLSDLISKALSAAAFITTEECKVRLYQRPFLLDPSSAVSFGGGEDEHVDSNLNSNSAAIIFNMALAMHLSAMAMTRAANKQDGISFCSVLPNHLKKVKKLYELAFTMILAQSDTELLLVVVNNLGVLSMQVQDHESTFKYFQYVLTALMYVVDQGLHHLVERANLDFLLYNALLAVGGCSTDRDLIAPAA